MHIGGYNKINKFQVDLYVCNNGENCTDDSEYTFLKTYDFYQNNYLEANSKIELSEIKSMLNEGNYFINDKAKIYTNSTVYTINQGNYSEKQYNTISK